VSTERQHERGTIGSQLEALRVAARADGHEVIEEFVDAGYSGGRLDRPALDRLRDAAEAGVLDGVLCLCVDRLARAYAYQVLILEELERFGVTVRFLEGPSPSDDPQATLLIQMQGVIAEYEKAKVAERNRRGKLYRARAGEIPFWKVSYGYRRVVDPDRGRSRIEVFEPEAQLVLQPRSNIHLAGLRFTRHQRGFTQFARPVFPSPAAARMERAAAWAFPRASHPADQEPNDARRGGDRPSSTDLELHAQLTSVDLQSGS